MADATTGDGTDLGTPVECDVCGQDHITEDCPMLGLSTTDFKAQISRARLTVPHYLGVIDYADGEVGIVAMEPISNKTQLGPFEAKKTCYCSRDDIFILKILSTQGSDICLDASSENHCNWMALVQVASTVEEQNCIAYQLGINIYFNTTKDIPTGNPLKVWYATKYAQKLGKPAAPDGQTRSMLGIDTSGWQSDPTVQTQGSSEGILEAASYLSSVLPSGSDNNMDTMLMKDEAGAHSGQMYSCSRCSQVFISQSDFAIHVRGHLMPTSVMPHSRGGKRGRPWGRAGVSTPLSRRGPGRPRKNVAATEPGEVVPKVFGPPRKRGRPRKIQPSEARELKEDTAEAGSSASVDETKIDENNAESLDVGTGIQSTDVKEATEAPKNEDGAYMTCNQNSKKDTDPNPSAFEMQDSEGNKAELVEENKQNSEPSQLGPSQGADKNVQPTPPQAAVNSPKKRGRPPKVKSEEKGGMNDAKGSSLPVPSSPSRTSRRVQPRRILKGKRTSTFRYPGESSSEDEDEKAKGKNVLKQALRTKEYSDDDEETVPAEKVTEEGLELGEVVKKEIEITLQTQEGVILSKAPVILLDEDTGQTQTLDPSTISFVSAGVDSDGQEVMVIQSSAPADGSVMPCLTSKSTAVEGDNGGVDTKSITTETQQSVDTNQDGLATLVDAALSSQKIAGNLEEKIPTTVKTEGEGEDINSDDPDWKGPSVKREGSPRKRRTKRRKGEDPDLELLEESIQIVPGPNNSKEYACGVCSKRFQQLKYLKMHLPAHTDKFLCTDCGRRFARHESLQKHVCEDWLVLVERIESEEDGSITFQCKECGRCFPQMEHARRHASMHRGTWACNKCQRTFPKRQLLLEHKCRQNTDVAESGGDDSNAVGEDSAGEGDGEGNFPCDICKQTFSNAKYLFRHMAMHTDLFKCQSCGKCYSRKDSLQRHILKCCPEQANDYSVFACDKCKKTFGTRLGLENHILNCSKFQCLHCRIAFFSEDDLVQHKCEGKVIDDAAGVQFPCKECGKTFSSLPYLSRHEASHHAAFECSGCKKVFVRGEELSWHQPVCLGVINIEKNGETTCDVCQTLFTDVRIFRDHYQMHTHPYRCDKCGKRFIKVGTLHTHRCDNAVTGTVANEQDGGWQCDICEKTFKNERYLARHKQLHGLPSFDCEYCGKKFIRKDYLNDHKCVLPDGTPVRVVRKKNRLYIRDDLVCPHCNKTFSSRSNLNKHMRVHGEKDAECHICGKKFHYHSYLKLHIATVHDRQFQYQCSHCGKILFSKTGLIAHIKQFHQETVKFFPCPKCGKKFRQKGNMRTHLYSHTKEKTFKCEMCPKSFKYPDQLNRHRLEHTLMEKIKCDYCDKLFVRASELKQHTRLFHSGVIYTCHICHESCAHKHTIMRHYRRKHPELADIFDKQPDFLENLQKPVDKASQSSASTHRLPIQLTAPSREGQQKPRIIRVLANGEEQEYIITTNDPTTTTTVADTSVLQVGDEVLPFASMTTEQAHEVLPQETVQALQNIYETDGTGVITQTVEDANGHQTVIILQVVNQDELGNVQEVAHVDGEHISIQEITMHAGDLGIEVPMEVTTDGGIEGVETVNIAAAAGEELEANSMEPVVISSAGEDGAPQQPPTISLVTSGPVATGIQDNVVMETGTVATSVMTVDAVETAPPISTVVSVEASEQEIQYM